MTFHWFHSWGLWEDWRIMEKFAPATENPDPERSPQETYQLYKRVCTKCNLTQVKRIKL